MRIIVLLFISSMCFGQSELDWEDQYIEFNSNLQEQQLIIGLSRIMTDYMEWCDTTYYEILMPRLCDRMIQDPNYGCSVNHGFDTIRMRQAIPSFDGFYEWLLTK